MKPEKALDGPERTTVHVWTVKGVPADRATRDYLADEIFPVMSSELSHWRALAHRLSGDPEFRYARCTLCGLHLDEDLDAAS